MRVRLNTILLKDPITTESFIPISQCNGKHIFDINSMINCSIIQNHQRHYTFGTGAQPNYYFLWKVLSLLNTTFSIGISTIYFLYSCILRVTDTINVKERLIRKDNSRDIFFSKLCKFFPFDLLIIGKQ